MMTSILLVDVQGLETRVGGGLSPSDLLAELTHTMHGMSRQIMVQRAYCSSRISTYRRNAYRDAGYQIIETAGPDETLITMTLDLADLSGGNAVYEEAILLGGTADYTALARLAHENLMMISVMDHPTITASLEALADGLIDPDELPISDAPSILDRQNGNRDDSKREETPRKSPFLAPPPKSSVAAPTAKSEPEPVEKDVKADEKPTETPVAEVGDTNKVDAGPGNTDADAKDTGDTDTGDVWPDPKTGPILIAGGSIADAIDLTTGSHDTAAKDAEKSDPVVEAEAVDSMESEMAEEIASDLLVDDDKAAENAEAAPSDGFVDLKIEDLVAEEFTETPAPLDPLVTAPLAADDAATIDEPAADGDPLDALFADLGTDLAPDTAETASQASPVDPLDSLDIAPEDLLEDLEPLEPITRIKAEGDSESAVSLNGSAKDTPTKGTSTKNTGDKAPSKDMSEEVDELLSRLMSDGSSNASAEDVKLDVVPER